MKKEKFLISMTKDEMLKFYTNMMVEDSIRECSDFSTWTYLTDYGDGIDLSKYKNEILELLYRDERIADVTINDELCVDMVFYTSYCPYFYDEEEIDLKDEIKILSDFYYYSSHRVYEEGYISVRNLIENFAKINNKNEREKIDYISNILKKNIINTGFIDKYIQRDNETFITIRNKKEFDALLDIRINELQNQLEKEDEEEI